MYSKVKILRRAGERKSDKEIASDPGIVGHVTLCMIDTITHMSIHAPMATGRPSPMIPSLWKAKVVTMRGDRMLVQGWERIGDQDDPAAAHQKQEWAIQVMAGQPEDVGRTPHRPPV